MQEAIEVVGADGVEAGARGEPRDTIRRSKMKIKWTLISKSYMCHFCSF